MTLRTSRCAAYALMGGLVLAVSAQAQQSQTPGTTRPTTPPAAAPGSTTGTPTPAPVPQRSDSNTTSNPGMSGTTTGNAVRSGDPNSGAGPRAGANSFTEGQARSRIEGAGYTNVTGLTLDSNGIWRGQATRGGRQVPVTLDYQGNVNAQ